MKRVELGHLFVIVYEFIDEFLGPWWQDVVFVLRNEGEKARSLNLINLARNIYD